MENRSQRKTEWFDATNHSKGPADYNTMNFKQKESFNYGSVPFGSQSNMHLLRGQRVVHDPTFLNN